MKHLDKLLESLTESQTYYGGEGLLIEAHLELLFEGMFEIDEDVEFIMDKFKIAEHLEKYKEDPEHLLNNSYAENLEYPFESTLLPSKVSQKASTKNPVTIHFGMSKGNYYDPTNKEVWIGISGDAVRALDDEGVHNTDMVEIYPNILNEVSPLHLKGKIAHELTHWLEDSLYENKMKKVVSKLQKDLDKKEPYALVKHRSASPQEIESFTHQLAQLKKGYSREEWDKLTFRQLFGIHNSLGLAFQNVTKQLPVEDQKEFARALVKRIHREGLLGKNMRTPLNDAWREMMKM